MTKEQYDNFKMPDRLPPTASVAMNTLVEYERERRNQVNIASSDAKEKVEKALKEKIRQQVGDNFERILANLDISFGYQGGIQLCIDIDKETKLADGGLSEEILGEVSEYQDMPTWVYPNPGNVSKADIKKQLQDKFNRIGPKVAINGVCDYDPAMMPVIEDYLNRFLHALDKSNSVAKRLEGVTDEDED